MKLIRLVTDNDGIFKSSFGNEMVLKENSKMALLNLTFQTAFEILQIDSRNNAVSFFTDTSDVATEVKALLENRTYNRDEIEEFYEDLKYTLNSVISNNATSANGVGSAFDIRYANGLRQIEYRYAPFLNPLNLQNQGNIMTLDNDLIDVVTTAFGSGNYYDLPSGGTYSQNTPTATVTFDSTDLGEFAIYRRTTTQSGVNPNWWIPRDNNQIGWNFYGTKPTSAADVPSGNATIDPSTGVLTINSGAQTLTPNTKIPDFIPAGGVTTISLKNGVPAVADTRKNNIINGIGKFALGSGMMTTRIANYLDNGNTGVQDNGFALCLSKTALTTVIAPGEDIDVEFRDFEIRFNRDNENYVFINKASGISIEQDSGISPHLADATSDLERHDILFYNVIGNVLEGGVLQDKTQTGGIVEKHVFFEYILNSADSYFPYIYIRGAKANISIDMFNYTIFPWVNNQYDNLTEDSPPFWELTGTNREGNPSSAITNGIGETVTNYDIFSGTGVNAIVLPTLSRWEVTTPITSQLTLNAQIWDFLGYNLREGNYDPDSEESKTVFMGPDNGRNCWNFWAPINEPRVALSDNFMVESMSVPLDSFDASEVFYSDIKLADGSNAPKSVLSEKKGRRKNILMTLPINNNTNGLVEYEAQNLIFIDINNAEKMNLRNMNFRILNKNFNSIDQSGESAVMTILID